MGTLPLAMRLSTRKSANPLDATMTKTQVVRRKFMSALPRRIENVILSPMEAMARTMTLFDKLRSEMVAAGLDVKNVRAGLVYCQPETEDAKHILAQTIIMPDDPGKIGDFCNRVMKLDKPLFLGVIFSQHDPDAERREYRDRIFVAQFMAGPEAEGRLIAARNQIAKGGAKKVAN
jgi:hypothetical protein